MTQSFWARSLVTEAKNDSRLDQHAAQELCYCAILALQLPCRCINIVQPDN
ncbi:hypothetical protein CY34DRAFT_812881 [Suillus luteus UH-Slu-Lm8-n1]|uniref:Uncharacterized protein n=1 Tax=Suillus luteus UH-Slu-Lm8-n1 TaxID=930992 RepID=A0A0D0AR87_9AGAM|nr:hypothetical protein CY34DRAFT_812881 [Suillus luteus UH-Slu-Lm8-n1]